MITTMGVGPRCASLDLVLVNVASLDRTDRADRK
jgi:hypothetical protein